VKRRIYILFLISLTASVALALGRKDAKHRCCAGDDTTVVREGIAGKVEIWEGNFMPMVEPARRSASRASSPSRNLTCRSRVSSTSGLHTACTR
jgi:hypothetical protein